MADGPLHILHVNLTDLRGGAERTMFDLHRAFRRRGHLSWVAVGRKRGDEPYVLELDNDRDRSGWARFWLRAHDLLSPSLVGAFGAQRVRRIFMGVGEPRRLMDFYRGREDLDFPATWRLLSLLPRGPDLIHCHRLNGGYFDLRALPWLSRKVPVVVTLHGAWLLGGHCGHSLDCNRWETGCGRCPYLRIYPAIRRDATALNWTRKREIYARSQLYVSAPSAWMMQKAEQSMLAQGMVEGRVIPNGVDLSVFHPGGIREARAELGIEQDSKVLLVSAYPVRRNVWKDYGTMREAVAIASRRLQGQRIIFIALGERGPAERAGSAEVRFVPFQKDSGTVARYYQAADMYVHAARAETLANSVREAMACGRPVVATAVGGIPEQVKSVGGPGMGVSQPAYREEQATGILVPPGDARGFAAAIERLLVDERLAAQLGANAAEDSRKRFGLSTIAQTYLDWYGAIIESRRRSGGQRPG